MCNKYTFIASLANQIGFDTERDKVIKTHIKQMLVINFRGVARKLY